MSDSIREWEDTKSEALEAMRAPHFWESDERHGVLSRIEYLDRLSAAGATAERLAARLDTGRESQSRELVGMLARRLHVLDAAVRGLEAGEPADAEIVSGPPTATTRRCGRGRGRQARRDVCGVGGRAWDARPSPPCRAGQALTVTGLGAFTLLRPEAGLHVFEVPTRERSFDRVAALVTVGTAAITMLRTGRRRPAAGERADDRQAVSGVAVAARPGRLGRSDRRIDRVLGGDFDLLREAQDAATQPRKARIR